MLYIVQSQQICIYNIFFNNIVFLLAEISEYLVEMEDDTTVSNRSLAFNFPDKCTL